MLFCSIDRVIQSTIVQNSLIESRLTYANPRQRVSQVHMYTSYLDSVGQASKMHDQTDILS